MPEETVHQKVPFHVLFINYYSYRLNINHILTANSLVFILKYIVWTQTQNSIFVIVSLCHRGGRIQKINAWYLNTHMVYL